MTKNQPGRWRRLAVAGMATTALLAGCGSDDDEASAPHPVATPAPSPAPVAQPAASLKGGADVGPPLSAAQLDAIVAGTTAAGFSNAARCDVQMVDITYATVGADGITPVDASGVVMVPGGAACPGPFPLVAYSRGTDLE